MILCITVMYGTLHIAHCVSHTVCLTHCHAQAERLNAEVADSRVSLDAERRKACQHVLLTHICNRYTASSTGHRYTVYFSVM